MPGGSRRNLAWGAELLDAGEHDEVHQLLVADAQTSGGLIFGIDPGSTDAVLAELGAQRATRRRTSARPRSATRRSSCAETSVVEPPSSAPPPAPHRR